ncbi:carboxymuconolactone decarboxylase family protein [Tsukamurella pseudospumae]|uniref:Carboxymuconolactone decarboxylase-like domain-containing protein n=1 Tax=Tsukamurella pseudospumae TaxID=239498 RepID=A0A138AMH8_9ACTN|nr:carboxymuconolactone decarboxylase family protein [Tsukamurella pseudospumae]KXP11661.1 hypothetical protein AXK60_24695 [Tsukamurella pseudospumae]
MSDKFDTGDRVRREVLGDHYVETTLTNWAPARPLLDLITEAPWGSVWARDGLDRSTRSLITTAILAALGRSEELKLHIKAAIDNNGTSPEELVEVALHVAAYAGVPAGLEMAKTVNKIDQRQ